MWQQSTLLSQAVMGFAKAYKVAVRELPKSFFGTGTTELDAQDVRDSQATWLEWPRIVQPASVEHHHSQ